MAQNKQKIGRLIKKLREEKGLTQEDLARALKIPRPSVTQLEKGKRDLSLSEFIKLSELLDVSLNDFTQKVNQAATKTQSPKSINQKIKFQPEKFRNLMLYLLEKCGSKPNIGETVLYKLLYFCDFDYFEIFEKPLTGMKYKKMQFGPVPAQQLFNPLIREMVENKELQIISINLGEDFMQRKYINLLTPNLSSFNTQELEVVNRVINRLSDMNARQIAAHVHGDQPWVAHKDNEEIDYSSVFNRTGEYAQRDYDSEFVEAGLEDAFGSLGPMPKDELDYYTNLPEPDGDNETG